MEKKGFFSSIKEKLFGEKKKAAPPKAAPAPRAAKMAEDCVMKE